MNDDIDTSGLPDRWDGDLYEDGKTVMPELGPKVGVHWGHLLMLEKHLRDVQEGLGDVIKADAVDHPFDPDDFTAVHYSASTTMEHVQWLESQVRGLRTGQWPEGEHETTDQSPPENPSRRDDPDFPF